MSQATHPTVTRDSVRSRLQPMAGRDPHENGRVASTLELLFDLTFVVAVATGASELAHAIGAGHAASGVGSFLFTSFGILWAWINYTWFASAYDTDDWLYRLLTMVQMIGVVVFTLGIPQLFDAVAHHHFDNTVIVIGYVIMRVAMLCQWMRARRNDVDHRRAIDIYAATLLVAQVLWIGTTFFKDTHLSLGVIFTATTLITLLELAGPFLAERGTGTPWHAHHICERHGLLTIITIGEVITGTALTLNNIVYDEERSLDWTNAILVAICGVALAFGLWWVYFITPFGEVLHRFRDRSFGFGYSHFIIWPSIAAIGGGLHVMALSFEHKAEEGQTISTLTAALALAVPVGGFMVGLMLTHYLTTRFWAGLHTALSIAAIALLGLAVLLAVWHAPLGYILALCTLVPWMVVAAYELYDGSTHEARILQGLQEHDEKLRQQH